MPFTVTMPKLSPTMETGVIAQWHKKEGEHVQAGDVLLEVATDKATVEHTALDEGWLRKILVGEGVEADVNQPIAIFTEEENESIEGYTSGESSVAEPKGEIALEKQKAAVHNTLQQETPSVLKKQERIFVSPLAKKIAQEKGIDLTEIQGSGPRNRIVSRDLEVATTKKVSDHTVLHPASGTFEEITLSPVRKIIAERLQEAKSTIPHFYVEKSIDASALLKLREELAKHDLKVSINDLVTKGVALALKKHPVINSGFDAKKKMILNYQTIDISIAVSVEGGLITPIVRNADLKELREISSEIKVLAKKAREGKLQPQEFQGGSFTISNLGMFGVKSFQAIINPPQAAILAVSGILDIPVVKDGVVIPGKVMNVTISVDHRVIDGVAAAEFLASLKHILENPLALII
ncbi:Dihydrolipoyllysine-residue acetyltransferase component of pyruvate dehydrogenase complex [Chlamydiales bacterium STE3]|nr:Dihydrolipoyllysine-residue acetyltransferase component of pyruvate dehydrogenase complex [Chlamydiales bacterium STE3]